MAWPFPSLLDAYTMVLEACVKWTRSQPYFRDFTTWWHGGGYTSIQDQSISIWGECHLFFSPFFTIIYDHLIIFPTGDQPLAIIWEVQEVYPLLSLERSSNTEICQPLLIQLHLHSLALCDLVVACFFWYWIPLFAPLIAESNVHPYKLMLKAFLYIICSENKALFE